MGRLDDCKSVRPSGNVNASGEGGDEDMADNKEEDIDELKCSKRAIIEKEGDEKEEEARNTRRNKRIRQPRQEESDEHVRQGQK